MNKLVIYLMVLIGVLFSYSSQARVLPSGIGIVPGETRTVVIDTLGASTASDVFFINMVGVTAEIIDADIFNFDQVSIRLTAEADANAQIGAEGKLVLKLPFGDTVIPVTIFCLSRAVISAPSVLAGEVLRVEIQGCLDDHIIAVTNYANTVTLLTGLKLNPENNNLYFEVVTTLNSDYTSDVGLTQIAPGVNSGKEEDSKIIKISFKKSNSFTLPAPTVDVDYLSSDDDSVIHDSTNGENSITTRDKEVDISLKWNASQGANNYSVKYMQYYPVTSVWNDIGYLTDTKVTKKLGIGRYFWKVKALYQQPVDGSTWTLKSSGFTEDLSFSIIQDGTETNSPFQPLPEKEYKLWWVGLIVIMLWYGVSKRKNEE